MNAKLLSAGFGMFLGFTGTCFAETPVVQGVIRFYGSIVEAPCTPMAESGVSGASATFKLNQCPGLARGNDISVRSVDPATTVTALDHAQVKVKLIADNANTGHQGRYYDQQYALVDGAGKPVKSGAYLITLTSP